MEKIGWINPFKFQAWLVQIGIKILVIHGGLVYFKKKMPK